MEVAKKSAEFSPLTFNTPRVIRHGKTRINFAEPFKYILLANALSSRD